MLQIKEAELHAKGKDDLTENAWDCNSENLALVPDQTEPSVGSGKPTKLVSLLTAVECQQHCFLSVSIQSSVTENTKGEPKYSFGRT